jgi:hypothetical protein
MGQSDQSVTSGMTVRRRTSNQAKTGERRGAASAALAREAQADPRATVGAITRIAQPTQRQTMALYIGLKQLVI